MVTQLNRKVEYRVSVDDEISFAHSTENVIDDGEAARELDEAVSTMEFAALSIEKFIQDKAELVKELIGAGDFARFLINNLSCATTEEDDHCLHLIDAAIIKHTPKEPS